MHAPYFHFDFLMNNTLHYYRGFCYSPAKWTQQTVMKKFLKGYLNCPSGVSEQAVCSIPEVTEEEDSSVKESSLHHTQPRARLRDTRESRQQQHIPQHQSSSSIAQQYSNPKPLTKEPLLKHEGPQVRFKTPHRVHYADPVENCYSEEDISVYQALSSRRQPARCPPQPNPQGRALLKGLGDRLRREAMLRSQMAASTTSTASHGSTLTRPHPVSKSVHTVRAPLGRAAEIDVEYGTDTEEPSECGRGEIVMEQMSSEWWVDGAQKGRTPRRRGPRPQTLENVTAGLQQWENNQNCPAEAGPSWRDQAEPPKSSAIYNKLSKGCFESPVVRGGCNMRIFVALFSYDPASMSPNPGAVEEELPFTEGQIIQVFGDKDADGFYHGECAGRVGLVPCNMVSEIQVEDEETRQHLLKQGALSTVGSLGKLDPNKTNPVADNGGARPAGAIVGGVTSLPNPGPENRKMVAIFDYDPRESSPNTDIEAELTFSAGDIIHVLGDMDEDGFFLGELNGQRGLVPSNFLQALQETNASSQHLLEPKRESQAAWAGCQQDPETPTPKHNTEMTAPLPDQMERPEQVPELTVSVEPVPEQVPELAASVEPIPELVPELAVSVEPVPEQVPELAASVEPVPEQVPGQAVGTAAVEMMDNSSAPEENSPTQAKKKKSFFSKGKRLFKKLGSSKKE
ncbi:hypothetical protein WMY93_007978 [Mugilogobius chulae]|uniref:SH3 domain-containing protein n=1 Tax=Mugilogobius chulae TaxID=88201 RepID=A0AAW0PES1_9GOBI